MHPHAWPERESPPPPWHDHAEVCQFITTAAENNIEVADVTEAVVYRCLCTHAPKHGKWAKNGKGKAWGKKGSTGQQPFVEAAERSAKRAATVALNQDDKKLKVRCPGAALCCPAWRVAHTLSSTHHHPPSHQH